MRRSSVICAACRRWGAVSLLGGLGIEFAPMQSDQWHRMPLTRLPDRWLSHGAPMGATARAGGVETFRNFSKSCSTGTTDRNRSMSLENACRIFRRIRQYWCLHQYLAVHEWAHNLKEVPP
jgi:hypothetical protein